MGLEVLCWPAGLNSARGCRERRISRSCAGWCRTNLRGVRDSTLRPVALITQLSLVYERPLTVVKAVGQTQYPRRVPDGLVYSIRQPSVSSVSVGAANTRSD